ncbi:hypothetical protein EVAR_84906_1 [Eumeta japonica]|uniref:Uncharacterized protein n=1 Tax=Eumeta variegata TaxID=151549 RepID=A0A4C1Z6E4_EUMVA|nr:hypothetical protein EVAR_84906_1 [Eumeta japonica]
MHFVEWMSGRCTCVLHTYVDTRHTTTSAPWLAAAGAVNRHVAFYEFVHACAPSRSLCIYKTGQDLEIYDAVVDVRCYELTALFLCSLFVPKCGPLGHMVRPLPEPLPR